MPVVSGIQLRCTNVTGTRKSN